MNNSISYDIKNAIKTEKSLNAESVLIHNKDVTLNFDTKAKCTCHNCNNEVEIVRAPGHVTAAGSCKEEIKDGLS